MLLLTIDAEAPPIKEFGWELVIIVSLAVGGG